MGSGGSRSWFSRVEVIVKSQLHTNMQQHVVLVDTDQGRGNLAICSKGRPAKGTLKEVESGNQPLDCLVGIARAMYGDGGNSQDSASPELPGPGGGGVALTWCKTQVGIAGWQGKKTMLTKVLGMKWKQWPICDMGMSQHRVALLQSH